jgi:hypothetical protein
MPRNGSGTYNLPAGNPVVTGTVIQSTWANNTLTDVATALTGSLPRDGQAGMSGALPMGGQNLQNAGTGTFNGLLTAAALNVTGGAAPSNGVGLPAANTTGIYAGGVLYGEVNANGQWTTLTPSAGAAFTINGSGASFGLSVMAAAFAGVANFDSSVANGSYIGITNSGAPQTLLGSAKQIVSGGYNAIDTALRSAGLLVFAPNGGVEAAHVTGTGQWVFQPPSVGASEFIGGANSFTLDIIGNATAGQSYGLFIEAGTNASDEAVRIDNQAGTHVYFRLFGDGSGVLGYNGAASTIVWNVGGNVTISAPASGVALTVNGVSGTHSTQIADAATNIFKAGYLNIPQNAQGANYSTVLADSGKDIYHNNAGAHTFTINDGTVNYDVGTVIVMTNEVGGGNVTVALQTTPANLIWSPSGTTGNRTLAAVGTCTAKKILAGAPGTWLLTGTGLS